jgi:hypothetical protein
MPNTPNQNITNAQRHFLNRDYPNALLELSKVKPEQILSLTETEKGALFYQRACSYGMTGQYVLAIENYNEYFEEILEQLKTKNSLSIVF